jgi:superfamily I DNA and RNA helicase
MTLIGDSLKLSKDNIANIVYNKISMLDGAQSTDLIYYQFPFYRGDLDSELIMAKLLLVSKKYGIMFFDCSNYKVLSEDIKASMDDVYEQISSRIKRHINLRAGRDKLKYNIVSIAVGNYDTDNDDDTYHPCQIDNIIHIINTCKNEIVSDDDFHAICSCIDGTDNIIIKRNRKTIPCKTTKADILNEIQNHMANFDIQQRKVADINIDGPQRIRGLAGSGKTIILTQKAALYHLEHPNEKILYTFYTKSLGITIKTLIERAFRYFTNDKTPNWENIVICHAWGSSYIEGVYSLACEHNGYQLLSYREAKNNSDNPFAYICGELIKKTIKPEYGLILIDEGQDFPKEFYRLCYKLSLNRRICWAYDDFQNIFDVKIQNERETFGNDNDGNFLVDFTNGDKELHDVVLQKCYRTPRLSLIAAFALGLGIYNGKVLQRLESNDHWDSLGFKIIKGNSKTGDEMVITRPEEFTPSYSNKQFQSDTIKTKVCKNLEEECQIIAQDIAHDINVDNLLPSDICVICLDAKNVSKYLNRIKTLLERKDIEVFNLLDAPNNNPYFSIDNKVTLSTVNKAKGNECGMVYICGSDMVFTNPDNVILRDKLFTAMTRTKGWLRLTGCMPFKKFEEEFKELRENNYNLVFIQPDEISTKNIENVSRKQEKNFGSINRIIKELEGQGLTKEQILSRISSDNNGNKL